MPEQEFDLYLSLLVKLLRLSPEQKTSIEAELRDHFEERFEALVRSGVPRDQAIRRTLDEFGDVAGLAHEFTHLARKHIRRRIMQGTLATAGVAAAVVIWATLFRGPEPQGIGPAPNLVAQEDVASDRDASPITTASESATTQHGDTLSPPGTPDVCVGAMFDGKDVDFIDPGQFLSEKLTQKIEIEFSSTPLRDVISFIAERTGLAILFDVAELSEAGISGDEEVSFVHEVPVHTALDIILNDVNQVELAWVEDAEVLRITTKDKADRMETTRYYNVRDLLETGHTREKLIELLQDATEGPWTTNDGVGGSLSGFGDLLIVKQCQRTQIDVACTLAALRSKSLVRMVGVLPSHHRINAALDSRTDVEFTATPLRDVVNYLSEVHAIPIVFDMPALNEAGITGDEEVTLAVNGIKLRSALRLLLESVNQVELDTEIRGGALWVTTKDVADNALQTVIYDVDDITENDPTRMEQLVGVLESETEGPWEDIDGNGGLIRTPTDGLLACRQPLRMQVAVYSVINAIRASLVGTSGGAVQPTFTKLETRFYRMDAAAAADVSRLIPDLIEPGSWRANLTSSDVQDASAMAARIGTIHTLAAGRMLLHTDSGTLTEAPQSVGQPETSAAESGRATAAASNVVVVPQAVLIITHKPGVQRKIRDLLNSLLSEHASWNGTAADSKVRFIAPGFQEGEWPGFNAPLGAPPSPHGGMGGGMGAAGFGVAPVGGGFGRATSN